MSSSRANWESIEGALLAQPDECNNHLPSMIFNETDFSAVTVPILVQSYYVLVVQVRLFLSSISIQNEIRLPSV